MRLKLTAIFIFISIFCVAQTGKTENIFIITFDGLRWQEVFTGADSLLVQNKEFVGDTAALKKKFLGSQRA